MTVTEYIELLADVADKMSSLCQLGHTTSDNKKFSCARCPMQKAEGKCCPVNQVTDIKRTLEYAVAHGVHSILPWTPVDDPMVILLIKRAVVLGYSVYTLRFCDEDYVKLRNLMYVPLIEDNAQMSKEDN